MQKSSGRFTVVAANSRAVWTNGRSSSTAFSIHHNMIKISEDGLSATVNYVHGKELKTDGSYYVTLGNLFEGKDGCNPFVETPQSPNSWTFSIQVLRVRIFFY